MASVVHHPVDQVVVRYQFGVHQQLVPDAAGRAHQRTQKVEDEGLAVLEVGAWGQHMSGLDLGIVLRSHREHHKVDGGALRVSGIVQLVEVGLVEDVVDHGRDVDGSDLVPVKVPELVAVQGDEVVLPRVDVAAGIAQPHIVAGVRQEVGQRVVRARAQEAVRVAEKAVLQQDRLALLVLVLQLVRVRNAEQGQHIAVLGDHLVGLGRVAVRADPLVRLDDLAQAVVRLLGDG